MGSSSFLLRGSQEKLLQTAGLSFADKSILITASNEKIIH